MPLSIALLVTVYALGSVVAIRAFLCAPEGYEDAKGFHFHS
jgi:hypothetical protein